MVSNELPNPVANKRRPPPPPPPKPSTLGTCDVCKKTRKTWNCVICQFNFCDDCWETQLTHRPGGSSQGNRAVHEKLDSKLVNRHNGAFIQLPKDEQKKRHEVDCKTTWLEYTKEGNKSFLDYTNRLLDVIQEGQTESWEERFPRLVSFVGQTGAGKSTLIRLLIELQQDRTSTNKPHPVPVPGRINDSIPTTGNVHLYEDPATFKSGMPIIYADCEGMSGGEAAPSGLREVERDDEDDEAPDASMVQHPQGGVRLRNEIRWAQTPHMQTREYAVTTLFPRILYTFSDVVVFVLREVKVFEDVLRRLINWASMSFDKAINQPTLPHIVIAINATDSRIDESQWDTEAATNHLLDSYVDTIHKAADLARIRDKIKEQGTDVQTTAQLLQHFYSSITVVRIPVHGNYKCLEQQVETLYSIIRQKSAESCRQRKDARMLLESKRLSQYIGAACGHFTQHIDSPFDFAQEARQHMSLPRDLSGHVLNFIVSMYNHHQNTPSAAAHSLLPQLVPPIASAIALEALRNDTQGQYSKLFRDTYKGFLSQAFETFREQFLRCSHRKGDQACFNTKNSHLKNHQARSGEVLSRGSFEAEADSESFGSNWISDIARMIGKVDRHLQDTSADERMSIPQAHQVIMERFYGEHGPAERLTSHSTCLCCLANVPTNPLPCGHVLCLQCAQVFGTQLDNGLLEIGCCPLHPGVTDWTEPVRIKFKPQEAGVRVLCLESGGVRSIVQVVLLQAIENELGGTIPIQRYFDLITGTGTGGVIALGLGVENWTTPHCLGHLKNLLRRAFSEPRRIANLDHKGKYRSKPLRRGVDDLFDGTSKLYGNFTPEGLSTRVAVTSTLVRENQSVVLANYNREDSTGKAPYKFARAQDSASELRIKDVARAAAAATPHFRVFLHEKSKTAYADRGTAAQLNPAVAADYERWCLWGDQVCSLPDVFLSLGTGLSGGPGGGAMESPSPERSHPPSHGPRRVAGHSPSPSSSWPDLAFGWWPGHAHTDDESKQEDNWHRYSIAATAEDDSYRRATGHSRNERLNISFEGQRPKFHQESALDMIEAYARSEILTLPSIKRVAQKLLASCFYFEISPTTGLRVETEKHECSGRIQCRFDQGSDEIKSLGLSLRRYIDGAGVPFFYIHEDFGHTGLRSQKISLPGRIIKDMCDLGIFKLETDLHITGTHQLSETNIFLCFESNSRYPTANSTQFPESLALISGFPRRLFASQRTASRSANYIMKLPSRQPTPLPPTPETPGRVSESSSRRAISKDTSSDKNSTSSAYDPPHQPPPPSVPPPALSPTSPPAPTSEPPPRPSFELQPAPSFEPPPRPSFELRLKPSPSLPPAPSFELPPRPSPVSPPAPASAPPLPPRSSNDSLRSPPQLPSWKPPSPLSLSSGLDASRHGNQGPQTPSTPMADVMNQMRLAFKEKNPAK